MKKKRKRKRTAEAMKIELARLANASGKASSNVHEANRQLAMAEKDLKDGLIRAIEEDPAVLDEGWVMHHAIACNLHHEIEFVRERLQMVLCIAGSKHLSSCDADGFCNFCGGQ